MRKCSQILFFLSVLFVFTELEAQQKSREEINQYNASGEKQGYWEMKKDGVLCYVGFFENGVPIGEFRRYDDQGKLQTIQHFKSGDSLSSITHYDARGVRVAEGFYWGKRKHGKWVYYAANKLVLKREQYMRGVLDGKQLFYSTEGVLLELCNWEKGKLNGVRKLFHVDGSLKSEIYYHVGLKEGKYTAWYDNGQVRLTGTYDKDKKEGVWVYYRKGSGEPEEAFVIEYDRGRLVRSTFEGSQENVALEKIESGQEPFADPENFHMNPMEWFEQQETGRKNPGK